MPWLPELFAAPALVRLREKRQRDELVLVPYFDGLMTGELDPFVKSFAGEPELHHPVRGRVKGTRAFEAFITETNRGSVSATLEHCAVIDDGRVCVLE